MELHHVYEFDGIRPVVSPDAFVHPSAVLIGDVLIGPEAYIGPCASLRGDFGRITIREGANVQDTCVVHSFAHEEVVVARNGHIGHGAVLHGCTIGENALIGMNAVVMDGVVVGENAFVAASTFVKIGFHVPANTLVAGAPARVVRTLSDEEIATKAKGTQQYQELARRSATELINVLPLEEPEPERLQIRWPQDSSRPIRGSYSE